MVACEPGDAKLSAIALLMQERFGLGGRMLVIGCGDGSEAAVLADALDAAVVGIDLAEDFHPEALARVDLLVADARELPFENGSFDLVFSYHALEHIPSPDRVVGEMHRVLRHGGGFWIGTPNRSRIVGYIGSRDASRGDKIRWNIVEWRLRLRRRFRNELGAHAGFTPGELGGLLASRFSVVVDESFAYYSLVYPQFRRLFATAESLNLSRFLYPSVYFTGRT